MLTFQVIVDERNQIWIRHSDGRQYRGDADHVALWKALQEKEAEAKERAGRKR